MDKIKLDDVKSSSRITPKIAFSPGKKMYRQALELESLGHGFDDALLFEKGDLLLEAGAKLAIIGENGVGKTTFLRCLIGELTHEQGVVKWSENAAVGYCPQDSGALFDNELNLMDWMSQWRRPCHNDLSVRGMLGRMLFTDDDANKKARNCSGGEKNRLLFGKLMMADINVLIMDEPTNHMDIEAIDALNNALKAFEGTLIFVSHDREFVSSLATRIIDIKDKSLVNFHGSLDEYIDSQESAKKVA
jgi:ATPase subunit of ABC transporter with duplicated ATPase domains